MAQTRRRRDGTFKGPNKTSWKKGQSGNPRGGHRSTLSAAYKKWLGVICRETDLIASVGLDPKGQWTWADVVAMGMIRAAVSGSVSAVKELRETTEGSKMAIKPDWQGTLRELGIDPDEALNSLVDGLSSCGGCAL